MKIMLPIDVGITDIISSSIAITETLWNVANTYNLGDQVYKGVFVYESAIASNTGNDPELNSGGTNINNDWLNAGFTPISSPKWLVVGMINRMRMFDGYVSTYSTNLSSIDVTIQKPYIGTIYLLGMDASNILVQILNSTGTVLWQTNSLPIADLVSDYYDWFFSKPPAPRQAIRIELGLITGITDKLRIYVTGSGTVKIGKFCGGSSITLGQIEWGVDDGIIDWSKVITDDFGETYLAQGRYVPEINATARFLTIDESDLAISILDELRATGIVVDLNESGLDYASLITYCVLSQRTRYLNGYNDYTIKFKLTGLL